MRSIYNSYFLSFIAATFFASSAHCKEAYSFLRWPTNNNLCENKICSEEFITFESLIGLEKQKKTLSMLVEYLKNPDYFERAGISVSRCYLLTGPSGMRFDMQCLSNALVNELNKSCKQSIPFSYYVIHPELVATMGIAAFAKEIKRHAPCVIYIHDVDELASQRFGGNSEILRDFFNFMNMPLETDREKQVIFLAITNSPESLYFGNTLKRNEIQFDFPDFQDRKALFQRVLKRFKVDTQEFDFDQLAVETEGCVYRDLLSLVIKKALIQANEEKKYITQEDLEEAINSEIHCILPTNQKIRVKRNISARQDARTLEKTIWDAYYKEEKASEGS